MFYFGAEPKFAAEGGELVSLISHNSDALSTYQTSSNCSDKMATPGPSQIILQTVQNSFVRLNVGNAGPTQLKTVVDEFQNFIQSRYPEGQISCVQDGENGLGKDTMLINHRVEQSVPGAYVRAPTIQPWLTSFSSF